MNKIIFEKVGKRLKQARELRHITLEDAGKKVDVHKSTVLRWENGETGKIKLPIIETLASFYNVNPIWLMGYDVPMENSTKEFKTDIFGNPVVEIPLLGIVKAGYDYLAQENWLGTVEIDSKLAESGEFFALQVKGDSMAPVILEEDIVIVKRQNDFENGDLVVAIVNGDEATIKKGKKSDSSILLQPLNPNYEPLIFTYDEIKNIPVIVVGIVKQLKREF